MFNGEAMGIADEIAARAIVPLPCPFCGEMPQVVDFHGIYSVGCVTVDCPASPVSTGDRMTWPLDLRIAHWNKRAVPQ